MDQAAPIGALGDGTVVHRVVLERASLRVAILTYGALIERLETPDRHGRCTNIVLGLPDLGAYVDRSPYFGATIGRYANRIAQGRFTLDGQTYQLACNDPPNTLHGGRRGLDKHVWRIAAATRDQLELVTICDDGEEGYPGRVQVRLCYSLPDDRTLRLDYHAQTDRRTVLNLTNHTYWNLAGDGSGTALGHQLTILADYFTPVDRAQIPLGTLADVTDTPFDFRTGCTVGARIRDQDAQLLIGHGYDHNWVLRGGRTDTPREAARLHDPLSGRTLLVSTDQPGLQMYSGNRLDGTLVGPAGRSYRQGDAVVLETQHFPDSPNQPQFPSTVIEPGVAFTSTTLLRFEAG